MAIRVAGPGHIITFGGGGGDQLLTAPNDLRAGRPVLPKYYTRNPKFHLSY